MATVAPLPVIFLDPALTPGAQAAAVVLPLAVHVIVGAVLEPAVFGSLLRLHPVVVLLALGAWFVLWGIPGAVLAVPITSVLCIVLKSVAGPAGTAGAAAGLSRRLAAFSARFFEDCVLDFACLAGASQEGGGSGAALLLGEDDAAAGGGGDDASNDDGPSLARGAAAAGGGGDDTEGDASDSTPLLQRPS